MSLTQAPRAGLELVALPAYADDVRAAAGVARLAVGVREHDAPARVIPQARVVVVRPDGITARERLTDGSGLRVLDSLPAGQYDALVLGDGFVPLRVPVTVIAGCRMTLEAYLVADTFPATITIARSSGRATITTCEPAPSRGFAEQRIHAKP
ncbi:MAG: carboxypeptidase-like regulatory domain-containing protein [Gemmatimonadaceae bacterium]|nr:carboxypeptidase-like regulatory domain-containing protein [Gemmatimonadaceae bacterium]